MSQDQVEQDMVTAENLWAGRASRSLQALERSKKLFTICRILPCLYGHGAAG